jgi:hypothetical protein
MSPEQRRYLLVIGCAGPAVANAVLNGALGWLITIGMKRFPVWTVPGVATDVLATASGVAFGTCLAMIIQVNRDYVRGKISAPSLSASIDGLLARFPDEKIIQSVWLGIVSVIAFATPVLLGLVLNRQFALDRAAFVLLKTGLSFFEALLISPLVVLKALRSLSRQAPRAPHSGLPR